MKAEKIYFNPNEVKAISMGLGIMLDDIDSPLMKQQPWTPEARKDFKEMKEAARSAAAKLEKFTGIKCALPPYNDGDENEFLTKES
jgi:hypothetical protein